MSRPVVKIALVLVLAGMSLVNSGSRNLFADNRTDRTTPAAPRTQHESTSRPLRQQQLPMALRLLVQLQQLASIPSVALATAAEVVELRPQDLALQL